MESATAHRPQRMQPQSWMRRDSGRRALEAVVEGDESEARERVSLATRDLSLPDTEADTNFSKRASEVVTTLRDSCKRIRQPF